MSGSMYATLGFFSKAAMALEGSEAAIAETYVYSYVMSPP